MMVHGLYQDLKIVVSSFGIREVRLCNVCCTDIHIQVSFFAFSLWKKFVNVSFQVISVDLSPAGILATGGGDWQARICTSPIFFYRVSNYLFIFICRELLDYLNFW